MRVLTAALVAIVAVQPLAMATSHQPDVQSGARQLEAPHSAAKPRPNIVLISADDMNKSDLRWMPKTRRLLGAAGVRVEGFISNHPLCCPARAEILTGQYAQNNGVWSNKGRHGGYKSLRDRGNHVATWLKAAGYRTAFVGKHLNGWSIRAGRQPGWTVFDPIVDGEYHPKNLRMYNNGRPHLYRREYTADLVGRLGNKYIKRFSGSRAPFFVWMSQVPPHHMFRGGRRGPPIPAPRDESLYPHAMPPAFSHPAFNEDNVRDKPRWVRRSGKVSRHSIIQWHRARIRSLASVDRQVAATVHALRAAGELGNTYIFFTSDNGYLLGEHRQRRKNQPYEPALRVPLLVRGPGLKAGTVRKQMYGLVDLAPTFVDLADARPRRVLDGRSMLGTLRRGAPGYRHYLIQAARDTGVWWWWGVRSRRYVYIRYRDGYQELYDMAKDPAQLQNVARSRPYRRIKTDYAARLAILKTCAGATCRHGGAPRVATDPATDEPARRAEQEGASGR